MQHDVDDKTGWPIIICEPNSKLKVKSKKNKKNKKKDRIKKIKPKYYNKYSNLDSDNTEIKGQQQETPLSSNLEIESKSKRILLLEKKYGWGLSIETLLKLEEKEKRQDMEIIIRRRLEPKYGRGKTIEELKELEKEEVMKKIENKKRISKDKDGAILKKIELKKKYWGSI